MNFFEYAHLSAIVMLPILLLSDQNIYGNTALFMIVGGFLLLVFALHYYFVFILFKWPSGWRAFFLGESKEELDGWLMKNE